MSGSAIVRAIITLLVVAIVGMILYWLIGYLAELWAFPAIFTKVMYTILAICGAVFVIDALLGVVGKNFIVWDRQ
jgi:hypothetical protein